VTRADRGADERDFAAAAAAAGKRRDFASASPFFRYTFSKTEEEKLSPSGVCTCVPCQLARSSRRSVLIACPRPLVPPRNRVLEPQCVFHRQPT